MELIDSHQPSAAFIENIRIIFREKWEARATNVPHSLKYELDYEDALIDRCCV